MYVAAIDRAEAHDGGSETEGRKLFYTRALALELMFVEQYATLYRGEAFTQST